MKAVNGQTLERFKRKYFIDKIKNSKYFYFIVIFGIFMLNYLLIKALINLNIDGLFSLNLKLDTL